MVDSERLGAQSSVRSPSRKRLVWLRYCMFISLAWTFVIGVFVVISPNGLRTINSTFLPLRDDVEAEWATAKVLLMKKEFGEHTETLSDFRYRMYGESTNSQIVYPTWHRIPWPSKKLWGLQAYEYERHSQETSLIKKPQEGTLESALDRVTGKPTLGDLVTQADVVTDAEIALVQANSRQSLMSNQKLVGRWLDLAIQDEAIDKQFKLRLEESASQYERSEGVRLLQEITAFWFASISGIFAIGFIAYLLSPWFSHTNRTIRVRRRLSLSASIMSIVLMVPISIVWELPDELPFAGLVACYLFPVSVIWLWYILWSWTQREPSTIPSESCIGRQ
ncbi:MAG: hypothetical protein H6858_02835 [Rhodospirillales bacterium]|nr:hypothetical protein [Alphaproteobacteria bacterium]MCB9976519.1 hypothetical protein [Rhodospirillales bacterium]